MLEIKDEDRIIGKICRGKISITDRDIKNLATANLDEAHEENFRKLAQEINETLERNQNLRKEMKEQIEFVEKDNFVKNTLERCQEKIDKLRTERNKYRYTSGFALMVGTIAPFIGGFIPTLLVSLFTGNIWWLMTTLLLGLSTGVGIDIYLVGKNHKKLERIDGAIKKLEQDRLNAITDGEIDLSKTKEVEVKSNIVNYIYKERNSTTHHEDDLNVNL